MTAEEQGIYRNLLDELWLREGPIPANEKTLAQISGDPVAWPRCRNAVLSHFRLTVAGYVNDTHEEVYWQSKRRADNQKNYRERRKTDNAHDNDADNKPDNKPASPSPSPSLISSLRSPVFKNPTEIPIIRNSVTPSQSAGNGHKTKHNGKTALFQGRRFDVLPWMHTRFEQMLGEHAEGFDLHAWYFSYDEKLAQDGGVLTGDIFQALRQAVLVEAERRHLPMAATDVSTISETSRYNIAAGRKAVELIKNRKAPKHD